MKNFTFKVYPNQNQTGLENKQNESASKESVLDPEATKMPCPCPPSEPEYKAPKCPHEPEYKAPQCPHGPKHEAPPCPYEPEYEAPKCPTEPIYTPPSMPLPCPEMPHPCPPYPCPEMPCPEMPCPGMPCPEKPLPCPEMPCPCPSYPCPEMPDPCPEMPCPCPPHPCPGMPCPYGEYGMAPNYQQQAGSSAPPFTCPYFRLAHAYVPWQFINGVYSPSEALCHGTLFPELHMPQGQYGPCEGPRPCKVYFGGGVPYGCQ